MLQKCEGNKENLREINSKSNDFTLKNNSINGKIRLIFGQNYIKYNNNYPNNNNNNQNNANNNNKNNANYNNKNNANDYTTSYSI